MPHDPIQQIADSLLALRGRDLVNEAALAHVLEALAHGDALTLEHLAEIWGVEAIYYLMAARVGQMDRVRVQQQLADIGEFLTATDDPATALMKLLVVLREQLGQRPAYWAATRGAAPPEPSDPRD